MPLRRLPRHAVAALRIGGCLLAGLLLLAIVYCALAPSSRMREVWFIPEWLGKWADRNPHFRNFPAFGLLSAAMFAAWSLVRPLPAALAGEWAVAFGTNINRMLACALALGLLGVALEFIQPYFRLRPREPSLLDVSWSVAGAFVGAFAAGIAFKFLAQVQMINAQSEKTDS
jgi:hypothetical protein